MRHWQCGAVAAAIFGVGLGMMLGLLFSSHFIVAVVGILLMVLGIILTRQK